MDMQLLRDLFANTIKAARILGIEDDFQQQLLAARARLAPNVIGAAGQLQEWRQDWDLDAPERSHRAASNATATREPTTAAATPTDAMSRAGTDPYLKPTTAAPTASSP